MAMIDAAQEFERTLDWPQWFPDRCRALGVGNEALYLAGRSIIGFGRIAPEEPDAFRFDDDGLPALIVPAGEPERGGGWRAIYDLIAFRPEAPARWWSRTGLADALGDLGDAAWRGGIVHLHSTPLAWLQAGGKGLCIVNPTADPRQVLAGADEVVCDSPALRAWVERRVREASAWRVRLSVAAQEGQRYAA